LSYADTPAGSIGDTLLAILNGCNERTGNDAETDDVPVDAAGANEYANEY
jgi:hypothetical protein